MSDAPRRGRLVSYWLALVLLVVAGGCLAASARGFLESTRLLWLSAAFSAAAIVASLAGVIPTAKQR